MARRPALRMSCFVLLALWLAGGPAAAFEFVLTKKTDAVVHWEQRCVQWWLHEDGSEDIPTDLLVETLQESFATWDAVEEAYVDLQFAGFTCFDDVGLADHPGPQNVLVWREGGGAWEYGEQVVAQTSLTYDSRSGRIADADIEFNGEFFRFATDGSTFAYDLQQTATHEIGHMLGLAHPADHPEAVMYAKASPGDTDKRVLREDDRAGLAANHPVAEAPDAPSCDPVAPLAPLEAPFCPPEPEDDGCAAGGTAPWSLLPAALALLVLAGTSRRRRVLPAALAVAALIALPARAGVPYTTDDGTPLHWLTQDLTYTLDPDLPDGFDAGAVAAAFEAGFAPWETLDCHPLTFTSTGYDPCPGEVTDDGVNCIWWTEDLDAWTDRFPEHLIAVTLVHFRTGSGEIVDVDTHFNAANVTWAIAPQCVPENHDLQATVTHETGHFVGLDHSNVTDSTMFTYTSDGDCKKRSLHPDDEETFCAIYTALPNPNPDPVPDAAADAGPADASGGDAGGDGGGGGDGCQGAGGGTAPWAWLLTCAPAAILAGRRARGRAPAR